MTNLYKYREELQKIEDECCSPEKHKTNHSHNDLCFKKISIWKLIKIFLKQ